MTEIFFLLFWQVACQCVIIVTSIIRNFCHSFYSGTKPPTTKGQLLIQEALPTNILGHVEASRAVFTYWIKLPLEAVVWCVLFCILNAEWLRVKQSVTFFLFWLSHSRTNWIETSWECHFLFLHRILIMVFSSFKCTWCYVNEPLSIITFIEIL